MSEGWAKPNVRRHMSSRLKPGSGARPRVVVAGGGVAALETIIALRSLAGERLEIELIAPERAFSRRSLMVAAAFGGTSGASIEINELAAQFGVTHTSDGIVGVDPRGHVVTLASGESRSYDTLIVAIGAVPEDAIAGALTFGTPVGTSRFREALRLAQAGEVTDLVFAVPAQSGWPLALYELALLTAERLRACEASARITLLTPEPAPLAVFGGRASGAVLEELEERGIHFIAGLLPEEIRWGELHAASGEGPDQCGRRDHAAASARAGAARPAHRSAWLRAGRPARCRAWHERCICGRRCRQLPDQAWGTGRATGRRGGGGDRLPRGCRHHPLAVPPGASRHAPDRA